MGFLYSGERRDWCGEDLTKCVFFGHGWYEKVSRALSDWRNLSVIRI
ncbi:MAG: hypothetical protein IJK28_02890 [Clostridia bacterium]|nr:hypothetical protein [Clostridia bacterium]